MNSEKFNWPLAFGFGQLVKLKDRTCYLEIKYLKKEVKVKAEVELELALK